MNTTEFEFECLASFGPIDIEVLGEQIVVFSEEFGELMAAPLTPELISELSDIAEETSPYSPDGHFKFPHFWPVKLPHGRTVGL